MTESCRREIGIAVQPWFRDHVFGGKTILPAVETLLILAGEVKKYNPKFAVNTMLDAGFAKFLEIGPDNGKLAAIVEISREDNDKITARLLSRVRKKAISRLIEHGRVSFARPGRFPPPPLPEFKENKAEFTVPAAGIYRELVPFGPAYRNIIGDLRLNKEGAWGRVRAPELAGFAPHDSTGAPFPFDAALHAACVWGQRFSTFVPFPVGFARRSINRPTQPGREYEIRVLPLALQDDELHFALWIFDSHGQLAEYAAGIRMRDVSGGRIVPPPWIRA